MSVEYFQSDVEIDGKIVVYSVPNSTGTLLTYNPTTKEVGTRTNAQIISDLGLNSDLTAYVKKAGDTMSGSLVFSNNLTGVISTVNEGTSAQWNQAFNWGNHAGKYFPKTYVASTNTDLNNTTLEGVYYGNVWTNAPTGYNAGSFIATVTIKRYSQDWIAQEFKPINSGSKIFVRNRYGGNTWSEWKEVLTSDSILGYGYVPYNGATSDLTLADKNLNFTTGAISKFQNTIRVFNKVFQHGYTALSTGIVSIKFPQATTGATMFDITIKIYGYNARYLGIIRVSFYKNTGTSIHPSAGPKAIIECTDNFPTTTINVGIDIAGNVCINLGDITTVWNTYLNFEVERVQTSYIGANLDWSKGWSQSMDTVAPVVPDTYQTLVNIVPEIIATRSWVANVALLGNVPKLPISLGTSDLNTIVTPGFYTQNLNTQATVARNYPLQRAGSLRVYDTTLSNQFIQEYTTYDNNLTYMRALSNGVWNTWSQIIDSRNGGTINGNLNIVNNSTVLGSTLQPTTVPLSGSAVITHSNVMTNSNQNYGLGFGSLSTGVQYIQATRFDGTASNYSLHLNPNGGTVNFGGRISSLTNELILQKNDISRIYTANDSIYLNPSSAGAITGRLSFNMSNAQIESANYNFLFGNQTSNGVSLFHTAGANTISGYGMWMGHNLQFDGTNFIQPRGDLGSYGFTVNYHKGFSFNVGGASGTAGSPITLTEVVKIDANGTITTLNHGNSATWAVAFNRNSLVSQNVGSSAVTTLDSFLPNGGYITNYGTATWGGSDAPVGANFGGFIKFTDTNNQNGLQLYYNLGHNSTTAHRLWFRTKNGQGTTNWFEAATREWVTTQLPNLSNYLQLTGGELTGPLTIKPSNSGSVYEQDVIIFHDQGGADGNIIPLAFKYGTSTTPTAFMKVVGKGLSGVNGGIFQFFDNTTKHTEINSTGITANSFVKSGGFSTQFLKADGSIDNNGYITISTDQTGLTGNKTTTGNWTFNGNIISNGQNLDTYTIKSRWLSVSTPLTNSNKVAYLIIDGFVESTIRQLVIEVESVAGNGQYKKLKKVFNVDFNTSNNLNINGSKYTEITGRDIDVRYGIGEIEKVSNTLLRIPIVWLSSTSLNINQITVKSSAAGILNNLTFSVAYDATSTLTTEVPLNNSVGTQILGIDTTLAGGVAITGGNTVYLRNLQPAARQDSLVRALRNEFTSYVASSTSTNYPTTLGTGIRSERYSSATDQRGFDIFSGGVVGQIYFKTFSAANADSNWEMFASREWATTQLADYVTQSSLTGYAKLADDQTFTGNNTFSNPIIVPDATNVPHAVNLGQMTDYVDVNTGVVLTHVANNYMSNTHIANSITSANITNWNSAFDFTNNFSTNYNDLVAIEALSGTDGYLRKDGNGLWSLTQSPIGDATSTIGGRVKLGSDTVQTVAFSTPTAIASRSYPIQVNSSGQLSVNIGWTDTVYTHPTTSGNRHIPAGGSANQILRWSADGTAVWGADTNTTYTSTNGIVLTGTNFTPAYGTSANTIAQGNDSRINNGQTAFGWDNHANAGYAKLANNQTFAGTNTFNLSPIIPDPTLIYHAVSYGFMANAIEESGNNTANWALSFFQTLHTPQTVSASKSLTNNIPLKFKSTGFKSWATHKPNGNSFIFAPSASVDGEDWDWDNQISFYEDGTVEGNKIRVRGGLPTQVMLADGSRSTNFLTTNTPQSITDYKTFEAGAELLLKGDDQNLIQSLKTGNPLGGNIVAGWYYRHYQAIWKAGCIRNSGPLSEGFGFDLSNDSGTTFERIFRIQHDSNLVTRDFGRSDQWYDAYLHGVRKNQVFSTDSGKALMLSDSAVNNEAGLIDSDNEVIIAGEENDYYKIASNIGGIGGLIVDKNTRRMGYGGVTPSGSYQHNFGGKVFTNDSVTSAGGFIHNDYNDPNKVLTSDGGTVDVTAFGGTTVKYAEINSGDSFTPTSDYTHWNVFAKGGMKIYLDSGTGSVNGQVITLHHNTGSVTEIWRDGSNVGTISGAKTTRFVKTSLGWQMTDLGPSNFI